MLYRRSAESSVCAALRYEIPPGHETHIQVISEPMKACPNAGVTDWLVQVDEDSVCLGVVTLTESTPSGRRPDVLEPWLRRNLSSRFEGRILPIDIEVAGAQKQ